MQAVTIVCGFARLPHGKILAVRQSISKTCSLRGSDQCSEFSSFLCCLNDVTRMGKSV